MLVQVGGTARLDVPVASTAAGSTAGASTAEAGGLFDDLVPTREEKTVPNLGGFISGVYSIYYAHVRNVTSLLSAGPSM